MTRRLRIAGLVSVLLHAAALMLSVGFLRHAAPPAEVDKPAMIELHMIEQQGSGKPTPSQPPAAAPQSPASPTPTQPTPTQPTATQPTATQPTAPGPPAEPVQAPPPSPPAPPMQSVQAAPPPPPPAQVADVPPPASLPPAPAPTVAATPSPPASQPAPAAATPPPAPAPAPVEFNLGGTDAVSNAVVTGDHVIPASLDRRIHNQPPIYPEDAARRGQHGAVVLLIHVSSEGLTAGTDVLQSSGVGSLDQAAEDAVRHWRFLPAVRDGVPVAFDMPMRFVFEFN